MDHSEAETASIAYKVFTFEDNKKNIQESLCVSIPEVCLKSYVVMDVYNTAEV